MESFSYIIGHKSISNAIKLIANKSAKLQLSIHITLCSAVKHALDHNDTTLVTKLYDQLPNSINKGRGVALWIKKYTNLTYRNAKDGSKQFLKPEKEALTFDLEGLATPFYDMPEVQKANQALDGLASVFSLMSRLEKEETMSESNKMVLTRLSEAFKDVPVPVKAKSPKGWRAANATATPSIETDEVTGELSLVAA